MNPIKKFFTRNSASHNLEALKQTAPSYGMVNFSSIFKTYSSDAYASAFPSIRAIANEYMAVQPHAIDSNGKPVKHEVLDALYHPNQIDSSVSFFEKIAVSTLVLPKTYLLVWRRDGIQAKPGGDFKVDRIAGFTFLEYPAVTRRDGKTYYSIGAQEFTEDEVLVLPGGVNPHNLYEGYSPSEAARRWARLDDYIADYQSGFFENNAIPAGQFIITAPTATDFNDTVDKLQERHRGAGKNGNVTYTHRPVDPASGKPVDAKIEWIPFSQSNKDIDFKNLFDQTNRRLDTAYGVPAIIKGIDDAATYANAQVADKTFSKRAVYPLLLRNYTQLTHELNRITNGLGVAITFKYDIPTVSDEEKVEAETHNIRVNFITTLLDKKYTLDSIVDAFKLPQNYKLLKQDGSGTTIDNDKPEVDEGGEVGESPNPSQIDGVTPTNGAAKRTDPKAPSDVVDLLSDSDVEQYEIMLSTAIREHMQRQIDEAIADNTPTPQNAAEDDSEDQAFTDDMLTVIFAAMLVAGALQYTEGMSLVVAAGKSISGTTSYALTEAQKIAYNDYLIKVAKSYRSDTAQSIRDVLARSEEMGWTENELEQNLRNIMNTDDWRVQRLATTEINRSQDMASVYSMRQIEDETDVDIERALLHTGGDPPCEYCQEFINKWLPVKDPMIKEGETITGAEGGTMVYTWDTNEGHDVHANGHCVPQYRVKQ